MDWPDDEFVAFLRRFQPHKPRPLPPTHHRTGIAVVAIAFLVVAVALPMWFAMERSTDEALQAPSSAPTVESSSQGGTSQERPSELLPAEPIPVSRRQARPPVEEDAPTVSSSPTLQFRGTKPPDPPPSNGPVDATNDAGSQRLRVGGVIPAPQKLFDVRPVYSENAQAAGIQGTIILGVVIGEDGAVTETVVLRSIPELDQAAVDAVRQWRFEPTLVNGEPVEVEMNVTVQFSLQ